MTASLLVAGCYGLYLYLLVRHLKHAPTDEELWGGEIE